MFVKLLNVTGSPMITEVIREEEDGMITSATKQRKICVRQSTFSLLVSATLISAHFLARG